MRNVKIITLSLCIVLAVSPVFASTINVPADQPTIQAGIDAAVDGDTILVAPGNYVENLDYGGKVLSLISSGGSNVTQLEPADVSRTMVTISGNFSTLTEFSGFTVSGGGVFHTILVESSAPRIHHNVFHDNIPIGGNNSTVIFCNNSGAVISNNLFYKNGGISCVGLDGTDLGNQIINNTFDNNWRGFYSIADGGLAVNNIISNSGDFAIGVLKDQDIDVLGYNVLYNNHLDYILDFHGDPRVEGVNDIHADPMFFDSDNLDYRLLVGSPCNDAGNPDESYNDPDGTRNDVGAFPGVFYCCFGDRGDVNGDGENLDIVDLTTVIDFLFGPGAEFSCLAEADVNASGVGSNPDIVDLTFMVDYLFGAGANLVPCP